jgi:hypothetical protein
MTSPQLKRQLQDAQSTAAAAASSAATAASTAATEIEILKVLPCLRDVSKLLCISDSDTNLC